MTDALTVGIITGLIAMGVALFERGYKRYLEEKKVNPDLNFSGVYLLNLFISGGAMSAVVVLVIPAVLAAIAESTKNVPEVTVASVLINATVGYGITYRILDGLNNSTSANITNKTLELKEETITKPETKPPS